MPVFVSLGAVFSKAHDCRILVRSLQLIDIKCLFGGPKSVLWKLILVGQRSLGSNSGVDFIGKFRRAGTAFWTPFLIWHVRPQTPSQKPAGSPIASTRAIVASTQAVDLPAGRRHRSMPFLTGCFVITPSLRGTCPQTDRPTCSFWPGFGPLRGGRLQGSGCRRGEHTNEPMHSGPGLRPSFH